MDVTCERCGTEYDFDETLVSERGTTVKCTNCGHLFKVFRAGAAATETDAGAPRAWAIRRRDGSTETLPTLRELQRRITEGALDEEDLISRSGEGWKRLGDIAELETFFHAARAAAAPQAAPRRRDHTDSDFGTAAPHSAPFGRAPSSPAPARAPRGIVGTREHEHPYPLPPAPGAGRPLSEPPRAAPPPRAPTTVGLGSTPPPPMHAAPGSGRKQTMMGVGAGYTAAPAPAAALPEPLPAPRVPGAALQPPHGRAIPPTAEYPVEEVERYKAAYEAEQARRAAAARIPEVAAVDPARRPASRSDDDARAFPRGAGRADSTDPTLRPAAAAASLPPGRLHVDDDDDDHAPRPARRGRARVVVGLALGLGVIGGGVALGWSTIGPALGLSAPADPAAPFLARGDEHLAGDAPASFGLAVTEYTKALAFRERDARVLAALSRAHAVWAQSLRFEAADLAARAPATPGAEAAAAALRPQQQAHTGDALRFAEDAVRQSPADADAELALADAQRLAGDLRAARAHLDRARTLAPDASAEALRVGALLAAEEAGGSLGAARELASAAVTRDPALLRARLLFARALARDQQTRPGPASSSTRPSRARRGTNTPSRCETRSSAGSRPPQRPPSRPSRPSPHRPTRRRPTAWPHRRRRHPPHLGVVPPPVVAARPAAMTTATTSSTATDCSRATAAPTPGATSKPPSRSARTAAKRSRASASSRSHRAMSAPRWATSAPRRRSATARR